MRTRLILERENKAVSSNSRELNSQLSLVCGVHLLQVFLGDEGIKCDLDIVLMVEALPGTGVKPQTTDGASVLPLELISPARRKQFVS